MLLLSMVHTSYAQRCRSYEHFMMQYKNDTAYARQYDNFQKQIYTYTKRHTELTRGLDTISVVVHVVYNTASQNISVTQIESQLDVLNTDYARLNADTVNTPSLFKSVASGTNFRFALARRDPFGKPTTGIVRAYTTRTSFTDDNSMKFTKYGGDDVWNRDKYLNIWVCNLTGGILGYTEYPGGNKDIDGVVVNYQCFGTLGNVRAPYNLGRTTTHEIGHWFNLIHIWGDDGGSCSGSDSIADTPNQADAHYDCPGFPYASCSNTSDMYMNYMDYSPDSCMNIFTKGQALRMMAAYKVIRSVVDSSTAYKPVYLRDLGVIEITQPQGVYCDSIITPQVTVFNFGKDSFNRVVVNYTYDNNSPVQYNWYGTLRPGGYTVITLAPMTVTKGTHTFKAYTQAGANTDNYAANDTLKSYFTVNSTTVTKSLPLLEDFESNTFPNTDWKIFNPDKDVTWARDSGTSGYGTGTFSVFMDNNYVYSDITGTVDAFITPVYNFKSATNPCIKFDVAYAGYYDPHLNTYKYDELKVYYSTDCGQSWAAFYDKTGKALETAPAQNSQYFPANTEWRTEYIMLPALVAENAVQFKFENTSGWGNELYIDNIKAYADASQVIDIKPVGHFAVYPNPTMGDLYVENPDVTFKWVEIFSMTGIKVLSVALVKGINKLDLNKLGDGLYILRFYNGSNVYNQKIILDK